MNKSFKVLSLGAGVQSSTLALMMHHGEVEKADMMIFADTGAEPLVVYHWLDVLTDICNDIPFVKVQRDSGLTHGIEDWISGKTLKKVWPPLFSEGGGRLFGRICTGDYKVKPIRSKIREMSSNHCEMIRGISFDEKRRAKPSDAQWLTHTHPLCDMQMTRDDCKKWVSSKGYPIPPRSSCVYCPNRCNVELEKMKNTSPKDWEGACRMDSLMRRLPLSEKESFVHRSCTPLYDVVFNGKAELEPNEFDCEGMCGV
jgi:hypothetical protein